MGFGPPLHSCRLGGQHQRGHRIDQWLVQPPQSTSTVLLPDGAILTAFGTGQRNSMGATVWLMDVALVKWQLPPP